MVACCMPVQRNCLCVQALERGKREQPKAWLATGRAVAAALLEGVLRAGEAGGEAAGAERAAFPYLVVRPAADCGGDAAAAPAKKCSMRLGDRGIGS